MQLIILTLIASSQAVLTSPIGLNIGLEPRLHPIESLHHSQDKLGHYAYGYAAPLSSRSETRTPDGVTKGGYSYIDSDGVLQTVEYTADPVHGFRVATTNLPRDLPDVAAARAQHMATYSAVAAQNAKIAQLLSVPYSNPIAVPQSNVPRIPIDQQLPQPVVDLPEVVKARNEHLAALQAAYAGISSLPQPVQDLPEVTRARAEHLAIVDQLTQQHAALASQVNLSPVPANIPGGVIPVKTAAGNYEPGLPVNQNQQVSYTPLRYGDAEAKDGNDLQRYSYGYVGPLSSHNEARSDDGVTRGGYSYIDANGIVQNVHYVADAVNGFRVTASNIPIDVHHVTKIVPESREPIVVAPSRSLEEKLVVKAVSGDLYAHEIVF
ncbi:unnamed protein product [Phaedon cochleariae]|uniref:Cuticle protein 6 n=1 Tax=Phaedon cochleariae TaxID=80249 RepID=A0A9P0GP91_PHACE|nr:unnamed protein product [Phaedon cochleariae]